MIDQGSRASRALQDKPSSIPTAQGLLILGGRECACGNHSQGFLCTSLFTCRSPLCSSDTSSLLFSDTAMGLSMAIDLGVQVDGTKVGAASHQDPMEIEVRKRLFWSCYVVRPENISSALALRRCLLTVLDILFGLQWDKSISLCLGRAPRFLKGDRQFLGPAPVCAYLSSAVVSRNQR